MAALPTLSRFAAPEGGQALNHPAFMTLDRLVIVDPLETLDELASNPGLLQDRPMMRAGFFARADPDDPAQVGLARDYLLSQGPSSETAAYFLGLFPNVNVVPVAQPDHTRGYLGHDEVVRRLEGALDVIATWEDDPRIFRLPGPTPRRRNTHQRTTGKVRQSEIKRLEGKDII
jgi:hypothetical protein